MEDELKACPFCAEEIRYNALKCRYCGEFLDSDGNDVLAGITFATNPGLALVLGLFVTGFGQFYQSRIWAGIGFMLAAATFIILAVATSSSVLLFIVVLIQLGAAIEAYKYRPYKPEDLDEENQVSGTA